MSDSVQHHRRQPTRDPVPGILQARTLEWVAISFSSAWKWKVKVKSLSRVWPSATPWTEAFQAPPSMGFSRQEHWSGLLLPSPLPGTLVEAILDIPSLTWNMEPPSDRSCLRNYKQDQKKNHTAESQSTHRIKRNISDCCFRALDFEIIYYAVIDNHSRNPKTLK